MNVTGLRREHWMAFIKCCGSNQYSCDCSVITDNETQETDLAGGEASLN